MRLRTHPQLLPYLALGSVCLFWGATYPGIRMALESFPPLLLVGTRFMISGVLLLGAAYLARMKMPTRSELLYCGLYGVVMLGVGNGCLTYSELWIPSGLAALFLTTSPFWMVGIEAAMPGGERPRLPTVLGLLTGLGGTAVLIGPTIWTEGWTGDSVKGFLILQVGCLSWSLGSVAQKRHIRHVSPVVSGAIQQLAAGLAFLVLALLIPEQAVNWNLRGVGAVLYLVLFGSIVGYTSYVYTLKTLPLAVVTIHVYVNPVVATLLGWLIYREPFGRREALAMAIIFLGVAVVKRYGGRPLARRGALSSIRAEQESPPD